VTARKGAAMKNRFRVLSIGQPIKDLREMRGGLQQVLLLLVLSLFLLLLSCTTTRYVTNTKRSAVEQLLVSKALEEALKNQAPRIEKAKVFLDIASLVPDENSYIKQALSQWFLRRGALLTEDKAKADYIATVSVGCFGTEQNDSTFGIPSIPVPLMGASTPEINLLGFYRHSGYAKVEIVLSHPDHGLEEAWGPLTGKSHFNRYLIFFISIPSQDIY
jgi:hypothetical protein